MTCESDSGGITVQPSASCNTDRCVRISSTSNGVERKRARLPAGEFADFSRRQRNRRLVEKTRPVAAENGFGTHDLQTTQISYGLRLTTPHSREILLASGLVIRSIVSGAIGNRVKMENFFRAG